MDNIRTWTGLSIGGAAEIGGEQTEMGECCAERVQPLDRGWIRTEQNTIQYGPHNTYDPCNTIWSLQYSLVSTIH